VVKFPPFAKRQTVSGHSKNTLHPSLKVFLCQRKAFVVGINTYQGGVDVNFYNRKEYQQEQKNSVPDILIQFFNMNKKSTLNPV